MDKFKAIRMVAAVGDIECKTLKERNEWKKRMITAGLGQAIIWPDDWELLLEEVKAERLEKALNVLKTPLLRSV